MSELTRRRRIAEEQRRTGEAPQMNIPVTGPEQRTWAGMTGMTGRETYTGDPAEIQTMPAENMAQGTARAQMADPRITQGRAVRTGEEEAAYQMGAKMGAQALAQRAGSAVTQPEKRMTGVTEERLIEAERLLMEYKKGKASVDRRIINAQDWWKMRNWFLITGERGTAGATSIKSATAWLWNCIVGKHAEAMDCYPEPIVLPRMEEDKAEAQILSDILPVVLQINGFEEEYSREQWQKFQEGTGAYHIGWDKTKLGGLGDISIRNVSLLNLFWEPGVEDIQESENLFFVQIVDTKRLEQQFPQLRGKLKNAYLKPSEYRKDDSVTTDGKSVLVDWYYHSWEGTKKVLHYCQFVNHEILYSTENEGTGEGLYADGEYPFVLDPLYPVHGSPAGYGLIDIGRDAQTDIDTLNQAMVQNAVVTSTPRWFIQDDGAVNEQEYADWSKPFVHVNGPIMDNNVRQIVTSGIQGSALDMLNRKIEELKFITGNTDVQNGSTPSGVTAASAIAALQEYSGRSSKDSTRSAYRAYNRLVTMVIERIRQFYDIPRQFRILGKNGQELFVNYSNAKLQDQQISGGLGMETGYRKPVFDVDVRSQRENAYTKMSQNELAIQFMQLGVFNPQMTDQTLQMLDMMDFRGKEEVMGKVEQQGTMLQVLMQVGQIALALSQKYQPEVAEQLAPILQSVGMDASSVPAAALQKGGAATKQADAATGRPSDENTLVKNARENANNATRPQ